MTVPTNFIILPASNTTQKIISDDLLFMIILYDYFFHTQAHSKVPYDSAATAVNGRRNREREEQQSITARHIKIPGDYVMEIERFGGSLARTHALSN